MGLGLKPPRSPCSAASSCGLRTSRRCFLLPCPDHRQL